jgi:hypothetical protein
MVSDRIAKAIERAPWRRKSQASSPYPCSRPHPGPAYTVEVLSDNLEEWGHEWRSWTAARLLRVSTARPGVMPQARRRRLFQGLCSLSIRWWRLSKPPPLRHRALGKPVARLPLLFLPLAMTRSLGFQEHTCSSMPCYCTICPCPSALWHHRQHTHTANKAGSFASVSA